MKSKLLIISYNEGEQDFEKEDIELLKKKILLEDPSLIFVCTQKSKSSVGFLGGTHKHFQHIFQKVVVEISYDKVYEKDAKFALTGVTENNNVRTYIYKKHNYKDLDKNSIICKLSKSTIGTLTTSVLNRQAIYIELIINNKKYILINTELDNSTNNSKKELEFIGLLKEFDLHIKINEGYNIFFCGSLNFRLNIEKNNFDTNLYGYLLKRVELLSNKELMNINGLKIYLEHLINKYSSNQKLYNFLSKNKINKDLQMTIENIIKDKVLMKELLTVFYKNLKLSGFRFTCDHQLENKSYNVFNKYKIISKIMSKKEDIKAKVKETIQESYQEGAVNGVKKIIKINKSKDKLPAMCDKILFAIKDNSIIFEKFQLFKGLKKSKNRMILAFFNI
jgi:hypothetical protein